VNMAPPVSAPVVSATPAAPAAANGAAPAAGTQGFAAPATTETSQDFLLTLGQLLGASAPTPASATQVAISLAATDSDADTTDLLDSAALEAMLPFSLATPNIVPMAVPTAGAGDGLDIGMLMPAGGSGANRAVLESLLSGLRERDTQEKGDATQFANLNGSTAVPLDEAAKARAASSSDPGRGLHTPVGSSEWADELSTRMTMMAERGHHTASLRLSPEHLGPLEIRISVTDDQASVWFGAAHADTRAAIEQALPRLRELFASQGLTLADAGVSQQAPQDRSHPQPTPGELGDASSNGGDGEAKVISIAHLRLGLVDAYA
jgi:flagellar hook-length control protein FliK